MVVVVEEEEEEEAVVVEVANQGNLDNLASLADQVFRKIQRKQLSFWQVNWISQNRE